MLICNSDINKDTLLYPSTPQKSRVPGISGNIAYRQKIDTSIINSQLQVALKAIRLRFLPCPDPAAVQTTTFSINLNRLKANAKTGAN